MKVSRKEVQGLAVLVLQYLKSTRPDLDAKIIRAIASKIYHISK